MEVAELTEGPIGIFDSGYGGLTILKEIVEELPRYNYIYLGDNARAPYGTRSFDIVYRFTLEAVKFLFNKGCRLVILACNTASAKALRTIQQRDLPLIDPTRRVLGVIRPTVEAVSLFTKTGKIGIFATPGTVASESYQIEISKLHPRFTTYAHACPMWVPLIENNEHHSSGALYFIEKDVKKLTGTDDMIDTIILGCTHYPLIKEEIESFLSPGIKVMEQGAIVAKSLRDYLQRHPEMEVKCARGGNIEFLTTESPERFNENASAFINRHIKAQRVNF